MSRSEGKGRCVTLHMVSSLDGFIAKKDNTVGWLDSPGSVYEAGVSISAEEVAAYIKTIDCYVMGSRTYEHALELGWAAWRYSGGGGDGEWNRCRRRRASNGSAI